MQPVNLTMLILSISVTFNVTCLTVTSLIRTHANIVHFTLADFRYGGRFYGTLCRS